MHRVEKGHGRIESRRLEVTSALSTYLDWPGVAQVMRITRTRTSRGHQSTETVYGITSYPSERANPEDLFDLWRAHWKIENRLHHVKDVTLREDFCRCRTRPVAEALAAMRNLVIFALRRREEKCIAAAIEGLGDNKSKAIAMVHLPRIK